MAAKHPAVPVHEVPRRQHHALPLEEAHIVAVRHEADVLAVALVGVFQPRLPGLLPDGGLVVVAYRQQQVAELVLGQLVEDVALVLPPFPAAEQTIPPRVRVNVHPGIVPRGDVVVAQCQRPVQQRAEF